MKILALAAAGGDDQAKARLWSEGTLSGQIRALQMARTAKIRKSASPRPLSSNFPLRRENTTIGGIALNMVCAFFGIDISKPSYISDISFNPSTVLRWR